MNFVKDVIVLDCNFSSPLYTPITTCFIEKNINKIYSLYKRLEDDLSKRTLINYFLTKINYESSVLHDVYRENQYFCKDIFEYSKQDVIVDGGAFTGDTLCAFYNNRIDFKKYYAVEPDEHNLSILNDFVMEHRYENIQLLPYGLWNKKDTLFFNKGMGSMSGVIESGEFQISVDSIDNCCSDATFIKMDIEGAEMEALQGAEQTIKNNHPKLAICVYHKNNDIFDIPNFILNLNDTYKIYLRQHSEFATNELVLYCV